VKLKLQIFLLIGMMHLAKSQSLIRGPYLTMATSNSVVISWRTDIACNSKVKYGTQFGTYNGGTINNNMVTDHVIKISGLIVSTKYYYTIGTSSIILQGNTENYFKTLPPASASYNKPIRILAIGDVAKATINEEKVRDAFLNHIDTNYIDAYLMLGDNAYPNGFNMVFSTTFKILSPSIPCFGRH
jgi:hypothetical protein